MNYFENSLSKAEANGAAFIASLCLYITVQMLTNKIVKWVHWEKWDEERNKRAKVDLHRPR
jgi:hypothetical protein